ncbi:MAG: hypothetical protein QXT28_09235 [Thermofilaceae archaeon]
MSSQQQAGQERLLQLPLQVPDVSIRYILENPKWVSLQPAVSEDVKTLFTLFADRDLALANHVNAQLALATWLNIIFLQDRYAIRNASDLALYRSWLQLLKSLHGRPLEAALQRLRGEVAVIPPPAVQPQQPQPSFLSRLLGRR